MLLTPAECESSLFLQSLVLTDSIQHVHLFPSAKMGWGFIHVSQEENGDGDASTTALVAKRRE